MVVLERLLVGLPGAALPDPPMLLPPIVPIWLPVDGWLNAFSVFGPGDPGAVLKVLFKVEPSRAPLIEFGVEADPAGVELPAGP